MRIYAENKRALFDYEVLEKYEAGVKLHGFEVKAVKTGHIDLTGSYVTIKNGEVFLLNAFIPPHQPKNTPAFYEPKRTRKLLLKSSEIKALIGKSKGLTMIPIRVYTKDHGKLKIEFALARARKKYDKREQIKKREAAREMRPLFGKGNPKF
jgi:SsrA-binding protein